MSVEESWNDIVSWLKPQLPKLPLLPPATEDEIARVEQTTGLTFPEDLRQLYLLCGGERAEDFLGIFFGLRFLSLDEVTQTWLEWEDLRRDYEGFDDEGIDACYPPDTIHKVYIHPGRIPVAEDGGGNYLGVDLAPDSKGVKGQIINYGRDESTLYQIALSFGDFLASVALAYRRNEYEVGEYLEAAVITRKGEHDSHYFGDLRKTFGFYDPPNTEQSWREIIAWLEPQVPELPLHPPATEADIADVERTTGLSFPDALRQLYLLCGGELSDAPLGIFLGFRLLSLNEVSQVWTQWEKRYTSEDSDYVDDCYPPNTVRTAHGHLPFAEDGRGNYLGVDFTPGEEGVTGQVISYGSSGSFYQIAQSVGDFLATVVQAYQAGAFEVFQDEKVFIGPKDRPDSHFLSEMMSNSVIFKFDPEYDWAQLERLLVDSAPADSHLLSWLIVRTWDE